MVCVVPAGQWVLSVGWGGMCPDLPPVTVSVGHPQAVGHRAGLPGGREPSLAVRDLGSLDPHCIVVGGTERQRF